MLGDAGALVDPGPALEESSVSLGGDTDGHGLGKPSAGSKGSAWAVREGSLEEAEPSLNWETKGQSNMGRRGKQRPWGWQ